MTLWTLWLDTLRGLLDTLSTQAGLGLGVAIILGTVLLRFALLPISWSVACRNCLRQKKMVKIQPALKRLKERHAKQPELYMRKMSALYRRNNLAFVDVRSLLGAVIQMPLLLGMFQVLKNIGDGVRFLWVSNLLRPDTVLALVAGATTALMMVVNPDMPEQMRLFMILVPSVIAIMAALHFCSALSIYWATANGFSAAQTIALHFVVNRRLRAGKIKI